MERDKTIELLKSVQLGTRPAKEVIEILQGRRIEVDNFLDALKLTSQPGNFEGEIIPTGQLKEFFETLKK